MRLLSAIAGRVRPRTLAGVMLLMAVIALTSAFPGQAARADHDPSAVTQIKLLAPWLPNGTLNPGVTVTGREMFTGNPNLPSDCQAGAITTQRPDGWRCGIADPCFAPPFGDRTVVACAGAPWRSEVSLLTLSRPLPSPEQCRMTPNECPRDLDLTSQPWAVELANGARCTAFTGTRAFVAGMIITHGCDDGGGIANPGPQLTLDKTLPLWRAFYLPRDGFVIEQVDVLVVWY